MFDFLKRKSTNKDEKSEKIEEKIEETIESPLTDTTPEAEKSSFFSKLKLGLKKTRAALGDKLGQLFLGKKQLDAALFEDMESLLLSADVGVATTQELIAAVTKQLERGQLKDGESALHALKDAMRTILKPCEAPLCLPSDKKPQVILVVGINGSGKTTSIGKLAKYYQDDGKSVMLAAGDTFRAAAINQLQAWGERHHIPVIAQAPGADTAAVIYDAMEAAKARDVDILIADTAGRLHTQNHLMEELRKIKRVLQKLDPTAPHEILLVLDMTLGQNILNQVKQFHEAMQVTGLALTKLDGTAKGGVLFAIAKTFGIPIRFIGIGEQSDDWRVFEANDFIDALFETDS